MATKAVPEKTPYKKWNDRDVYYLVNATEDYVVYIDSFKSLEWETDDKLYQEARFPAEWSLIASREALLEDVLLDEVSPRALLAFKRLLGEALTRGFEGYPSVALMTLDRAEVFANERNREVGRLIHLHRVSWTAGVIVLPVLLLSMATSLFPPVKDAIGAPVLESIRCGGAGAVGALMSIFMNVGAFRDPYGDSRLQRMEASARIVVGAFGAMFASLVVHSDLVKVGGTFDNLYALLAFSIVAGASERLVPDLIRKIDGSPETKPNPSRLPISPTADGTKAPSDDGKAKKNTSKDAKTEENKQLPGADKGTTVETKHIETATSKDPKLKQTEVTPEAGVSSPPTTAKPPIKS